MPEHKGKSPEAASLPVPTDLPSLSSESPTTAKPTSLGTLRSQILASREKSPFDAAYFLPCKKLRELVNKDSIRVALGDPSDETITFVEQKAIRFFTILVCMHVDLVSAINSLWIFDLTDNFLPISKEAVEDNCKVDDSNRKCDHASQLCAFHYEPWHYGTLLELYEKQWEFYAPVFTSGPDGYVELRLHSRSILPFIKLGHDRKAGAFGNIYQVWIHPDHQNLLPDVRAPATQYLETSMVTNLGI
jgi:hypothetical protein